jgi:hypothetical protein
MKKIFFTLLAIMLSYSALNAQSISLGPQLGYVKATDADDPTYILGAALRVKFAGFLGAELSGAYKKEEYANGLVKVHTYPILVTGLLHFIPPFYAAAGIGWYNTKIQFDKTINIPDQNDSQIGYHIGGGVELALGRLILTGDIKYIFLNLDLANLSKSKIKDLKSDFMVISVGALIQLSK